VSSYGLGIVLICAVVALLASFVVASRISDPSWRRVIFFAGIAAAVFFVGIQPQGYDQWDAYAATWYSGGALLGWFAGFGVATLSRGRHGT
jgi:hypothetical protein